MIRYLYHQTYRSNIIWIPTLPAGWGRRSRSHQHVPMPWAHHTCSIRRSQRLLSLFWDESNQQLVELRCLDLQMIWVVYVCLCCLIWKVVENHVENHWTQLHHSTLLAEDKRMKPHLLAWARRVHLACCDLCSKAHRPKTTNSSSLRLGRCHTWMLWTSRTSTTTSLLVVFFAVSACGLLNTSS